MTKTALFAPLAALMMTGLLAAAPALAQETAAPAEAPAAEAPAADATAAPVTGDAPTADGLSMGAEAVPEEGGVGSTYVSATFDLWEQRCVRTEDGSDPCQLYQLLKDAQGGNLAEISMFALPPGGQASAGATIVVPLETLLTANLTLAIDGGKAKVYPYTFCAPIGCIARVGFTAEEVEQFRKGAKAVLTLVPAVAPDQKVTADISLKGFTAGYEAVAATAPKQ